MPRLIALNRSSARRVAIVLGAFIITLIASPSLAATQEEVFKSINQNVDSTVDLNKALPYLIATAAAMIMFAIYTNRKQRNPKPRMVNHAGKLTRRLARRLHLRSSEVKQLKILAEEQDLTHPLTLLLCPSILAKAMRTNNPRLDRKVLSQLVQRLRSEANRRP